MVLNISESEIATVLDYATLIPAMERTLSDFSEGKSIQPVRQMLVVEESQRFLGVMPAVTGEVMGAKLVCFYPKNADTSFPTHLATITLFSSETGQPLAFMDGRLITEMRTAAVSAAITKYLAPAKSKVLAMLGQVCLMLADLLK